MSKAWLLIAIALLIGGFILNKQKLAEYGRKALNKVNKQ